eukprot:CAMPEP_0116909428 /NCGR_PEP_ID=MMETSP0467-20121206/14270_1 /TAXON_ID=283647 /ORGANISM="Mesodinium pulex, Strain SPMC105" /LENGTH=78 /DNA_ID=CAMNT_0004584785 /DNA_START=161 /DNA_END=396 /DNA_ORIENTATION=+
MKMALKQNSSKDKDKDKYEQEVKDPGFKEYNIQFVNQKSMDLLNKKRNEQSNKDSTMALVNTEFQEEEDEMYKMRMIH